MNNMSKQLYEEALADVRKVKEVAEDNAKREIMKVVVPRIREMIETELLGLGETEEEDDSSDEDSKTDVTAPGSAPLDGQLMTDGGTSPDAEAAQAISTPDDEGKVTLELDALPGPSGEESTDEVEDGEELELNSEAVFALSQLVSEAGEAEVIKRLVKIDEAIQRCKKNHSNVKQDKIAEMISYVENMYEYVQESMGASKHKNDLEVRLEQFYKDLNTLKEQKNMSTKKQIKKLNEADVTLKLTGLPDDVDLDTVGVDLITGEEEEVTGEDELGGEGEEGTEEGGEDGDELELSDLEGGEEGTEEGEEEEEMGESVKLSNDTVIEIDEGMLRREIKRMRALREEAETKPNSWGNKPGKKQLATFGGAKDEGDALDQDIEDAAEVVEGYDSADEDADDLDEITITDDVDEGAMCGDDDLDESEELDQIGDKRTRDDIGGSETTAPTVDKDNPANRMESVQRRLSFEKRLQERSRRRALALKLEAARSTGRKLAVIKAQYKQTSKRFAESVVRSKKLLSLVTEIRQGVSSNSASRQPADKKAEAVLRNKLAEANLFNAKLLYTNRLLQNESLSARQKSQVIERLDEAHSEREVKLVYESIVKTLSGPAKQISENADRRVIGSGSRPMRSASTQQVLNEGIESSRWAKLAGINK